MEESLEARFRKAFPLRPVPARVVDTPWDPPGQSDERQLVETFGGRRWNAIDPTALIRACDGVCLPFMTPEAFAYYLPALMLRIREADPRTEGWIDYVEYAFESELQASDGKVRRLLSRKQLRLVADFVREEKLRWDGSFQTVDPDLIYKAK